MYRKNPFKNVKSFDSYEDLKIIVSLKMSKLRPSLLNLTEIFAKQI